MTDGTMYGGRGECFFLKMTECWHIYPSQSIDTDTFSAQCILTSKHAFIAGINRFAVSLSLQAYTLVLV